MPIGISISMQQSGTASAQIVARERMLRLSRDLCYTAVRAFSDHIEQNAPRQTGYMAKRIATIRRINSSGDVVGYGAGVWSLIGPPNQSERGTIKAFIKNHPSMRGRIPISGRGAWWALTPAGKELLRSARLRGNYGGSKPSYWYAIVLGKVPNRIGGNLPANDFVSDAIFVANDVRYSLAYLMLRAGHNFTDNVSMSGSLWNLDF